MATGRYVITDAARGGGNYPTKDLTRAKVQAVGGSISLDLHSHNQYGQRVCNTYTFSTSELGNLIEALERHLSAAEAHKASLPACMVVEG